MKKKTKKEKGNKNIHSYKNINLPNHKFFKRFISYLSIRKIRRNLEYLNIPTDKLTFIIGDSKDTIPTYFNSNPDKKFNYVLVDGGHDKLTAYADLENVSKHIAKGGVLVFDDIGPESHKLIDVWKKFKKNHEEEFTFYEVLHRKGVAWAFKK